MFKHYLKIAWRNIFKNRIATFVNLFGLSLALTSFLFISLWIKNELTFDNYHKGVQDIYLTEFKFSQAADPNPITVLPLANVLEKDPHVTSVARLARDERTVHIGQHLYKIESIGVVDSAWFDIFDYTLVHGSFETFNRNASSLILTKSKAKQLFGNIDPVGRLVTIDSNLHSVAAVVEDNPVNSSFQFDMLMPMSFRLSQPGRMDKDNTWGNASYRTFVKLRRDTKLASFQSSANVLIRNASGQKEASIALQPLRDMHFDNVSYDPVFRRGSYSSVIIFGILSLLLLVIASVNYINLTIASANERSREIGIRKIIGGTRGQLFVQFLTESFLLCLVALFVSLSLLGLLLPIFNYIAESRFTLLLLLPVLWKIILGTLLLTTLLNGVLPALTMAYFKPLNFLRGYSILKFKSTFFRKGLVVFQFVISLVLIIGTLVVYLQMRLAQSSSAQYNRNQVVMLNLPTEIRRKLKYNGQRINEFCQTLKNELLAKNVIRTVAFGSTPIEGNIMNSSSAPNYYFPGIDTSLKLSVVRLGLSPDANDIFSFHLKEGRWFNNDNSDKGNFILNETAIRELGIPEPAVGRFFAKRYGDTGRIIGIIEDYAFRSLYDKIGPMAIVNSDDDSRGEIFIKIASGKIQEGMKTIESTWKEFIPQVPFEYQFMNQVFDNLYKDDLKVSRLTLAFGGITMLISLLGLFGLAAFISEQKAKEIGIRKVFGAGVRSIMVLLSGNFMKLVLIGFFLAIPLAWWAASEWLESFAYKIHLNVWIFILPGLFVMLIAFLTVSMQTFRAACANPVESLKNE
ncbi:ABC transporter permease [Arachidicoccus terrestris]|uniref:ABC transporter permease n=1 Tax=Arachidicoccus terrestris TaxID=2875539 RepID=UPI001CC5B9B8|nr:ABC transporter permease [Arachidicoccus terrestris]UAY54187.1 ABC transporter permease [Arachidicoccus terrestris]